MDDRSPAERAESLRREIRRHNHLYYVLDAPEISDEEYDHRYFHLKRLEEEPHKEDREGDLP